MIFVVLGGSFTGLSVAVTLAKLQMRHETEIVIIEPKAYLEMRWATIRSMFEEEVLAGSTVPLSKILKPHSMIKHVRARAKSINIDDVLLDTGVKVKYDVLLVATGAETAFPALTPHLTPGTLLQEREAIFSRKQLLRDTGDGIIGASSVLIIGGGPVGTELAADIATFAKARNAGNRVTLIDTKDRLIASYSPLLGERLEEKLSSLGVDVILKHRAVQELDGTWKIEDTGQELNADIVIRTTGIVAAAPDLFGEDSGCTNDGWIRTDEYGRVVGARGNIFAGGDCCDWKSKSGENTLANRHVYAHNVRVTLEAIATHRALASTDRRLKRVSKQRSLAVVTSAPKDGMVALPLSSMSLFLPWVKNRGAYLAKAQKEIGW